MTRCSRRGEVGVGGGGRPVARAGDSAAISVQDRLAILAVALALVVPILGGLVRYLESRGVASAAWRVLSSEVEDRTVRTPALRQPDVNSSGSQFSQFGADSIPSPISLPAAQASFISGTYLWAADAEKSIEQEFNNYSAVSSSRITRVESPCAQGTHAYRFELRDGDTPTTKDERVEAGQGGTYSFPGGSFDASRQWREGDDVWIAFQVYLPDSWNTNPSSWQILSQLSKHAGTGGPALELAQEGGKLKLTGAPNSKESTRQQLIWEQSDTVPKNRWLKILAHVKLSSSTSVGFVELYGDLDGQALSPPLPRIMRHTLKTGTTGSHMRIGIYRSVSISGNTFVYFDGLTVARTRAEAEANAFRPRRPAPAVRS